MKTIVTCGILVLCVAVTHAQQFTEPAIQWNVTKHMGNPEDGAKIKVSEVRVDSQDKVGDKNSIAYDIAGDVGPDLWLALRSQNFPKEQPIVDLTKQKALVFSYKILIRKFTTVSGENSVPAIGYQAGGIKADHNGRAYIVGQYICDEQWHEVVIPIEKLVKDKVPGKPEWDMTDCGHLVFTQALGGTFKQVDLTIKFAAIRFEPKQ